MFKVRLHVKKELPATQLRIKNKTRLTLCVSIVIRTILAALMPRPKPQQIEYRPYKVGYGDTYWQLARKAQDNGYNADIRIIVDEMTERSGIKAHELKEGDTIFIPEVITDDETAIDEQ